MPKMMNKEVQIIYLGWYGKPNPCFKRGSYQIQQLTETHNDNKLKTLNLFKIIKNTTTIQSIKITPKKKSKWNMMNIHVQIMQDT